MLRAKSIRGYNTAAGKITHNKWQLGVGFHHHHHQHNHHHQPEKVENSEIVEDWDQRDVTSTLSRQIN